MTYGELSGWDTPGIIDRLAVLWAEGHSCSAIAEKLHQEFRVVFSRNAVIGKAHRLGLAGRDSPIKQRGERAKKRQMQKARAKFLGVEKLSKHTPARVVRAYVGPLPSWPKCQWIEREPTMSDDCKCLAPSLEWSSYCAEHHARVYRPTVEAAKASFGNFPEFGGQLQYTTEKHRFRRRAA